MSFAATLITQHSPAEIISRGKQYQSRVKIHKVQPGKVTAWVFGSRRYTTTIERVDTDTYQDTCTCPYGATCKHTIALAFVLEKQPGIVAQLDMLSGSIPDLIPQDQDLIAQRLLKNPEILRLLEKIKGKEFGRMIQQEIPNPLPPPHPILKLLDLIKQDTQTKHAPIPSTIDCCYYVVHARGMERYRYADQQQEIYLGLEAGRATKKNESYAFQFRDPQAIRSMHGRNAAYLTDLDRKILSIAGNSYIPGIYDYAHANAVLIDTLSIDELLRYLSRAPLLFWEEKGTRIPLTIEKDPVPITFALEQQADGYRFVPTLMVNEQAVAAAITHIFSYTPIRVRTADSVLYTLTTDLSAATVTRLLHAPAVPTGMIDAPDMKYAILDGLAQSSIRFPDAWTADVPVTQPMPEMIIHARDYPWQIGLRFRYERTTVHHGETGSYYHRNDPASPVGKRDTTQEEHMAAMLQTFLTDQPVPFPYPLTPEQQTRFFSDILPAIPADWQVFLEKETAEKIHRTPLSYAFETTSGIDWLDISGTLTVDNQNHAFSDLFDSLFTNEPLIQINGAYHVLPKEFLQTMQKLAPLTNAKEKHIRLHRTHIGLLDDLADVIPGHQLAASWQQTLSVIRNFSGITPAPVIKTLHATLRPYQKDGVDMLNFWRTASLGGILADDMGLGKTIQAIAILLIAHNKQPTTNNPQPLSPSLVVAPTSVVSNWEKEIETFAPTLRTYCYIGKDRAVPKAGAVDVILTSYAFLWRDREILTKTPFHYVILDEAQYIKNVHSQTAKTARNLQAVHRLCLSGTPLENNITELYSQFSFANPGMFADLETFQQRFSIPIEKYQDAHAKKYLKKLIHPFILRRTKEQVAPDLPAKIEQTRFCLMEKEQRTLYEAVRKHYQQKLLPLVEKQGVRKSQFQILEALLRLRQVCCDPRLLKLDQRDTTSALPRALTTQQSCKREATMALLEQALTEGHSVLLFSQFVQMLTLLSQELTTRKLAFLFLHGQTKSRATLVDTFQKQEKPTVFLLSLKAGGTGLNLTAAGYVIHYDPWWNPAVEMQATDRAHRIGQTKTVHVYKLLVKDSIEEKIQALQEKKKGLIDDLVSATAATKRITREDLSFLLS